MLLAIVAVGTASAATPVVTQIIPSPGATVFSLDSVEVFFSTDVGVVDAADLLINGQPASELESFGYAHYLFHFPPPARLGWWNSHGRRNTAFTTGTRIASRAGAGA